MSGHWRTRWDCVCEVPFFKAARRGGLEGCGVLSPDDPQGVIGAGGIPGLGMRHPGGAVGMTRMRTLRAVRPLGNMTGKRLEIPSKCARRVEPPPQIMANKLSAAIRVCGVVFQQPVKVFRRSADWLSRKAGQGGTAIRADRAMWKLE